MTTTLPPVDDQDHSSILHEIGRVLRGLRFGAVEITVHNGQIVQIERKEKIRPPATASRQA